MIRVSVSLGHLVEKGLKYRDCLFFCLKNDIAMELLKNEAAREKNHNAITLLFRLYKFTSLSKSIARQTV